uniref:Uncharacterized protein n=1 Tax=Haplochromis burtoni TaxID=8153 RepID=A0A3Q2WHT2_HAPBU
MASYTVATATLGLLVFPVDESHWLNMKVLVKALHSQGHQITVLRSSTSWYISEFSPYYTSITIIQEESQPVESQDFMSSFLKRSVEINKNAGSLWNMFTLLLQNQEVVAKFTSAIFENKTLIGDLNKTGYDLFLTDPTFPGGVLLAHYLQLPLVFNVRWLFSGEAHLAVAPSPVSYIPVCFSHNSDKMDFFQRIRNMIHYIMALCDRYFGNNVSLMSLTQKADLWLMRVDFTFEFPRPTMPSVIYIGGFQGKPSKAFKICGFHFHISFVSCVVYLQEFIFCKHM